MYLETGNREQSPKTKDQRPKTQRPKNKNYVHCAPNGEIICRPSQKYIHFAFSNSGEFGEGMGLDPGREKGKRIRNFLSDALHQGAAKRKARPYAQPGFQRDQPLRSRNVP